MPAEERPAPPPALPPTAPIDASPTPAPLARGAGGPDDPLPCGGLDRRELVAVGLGAALALTFLPAATSAQTWANRMIPPGTPAPDSEGAFDVRLDVNGRELTLRLEPQVTLLDAL